MQLQNNSDAWQAAMLSQERKLRRQVSQAITNYRGSTFVDEHSHFPAHQWQSPRRLRAHLVPFDEQGEPGTSCRIEVTDFDERGITFHHCQPLHCRRALAVLEGLNLGRIAAEVDLSWCRFSRRGRYTSGGRFVQLVDQSA